MSHTSCTSTSSYSVSPSPYYHKHPLTSASPVFYKPYESQGQAWPITFVRLIWGVLIFIVFMIGLFILKKSFILASLLAPLLGGTLLWWYYTDKQFRPLSKYVSLSSVHEVERGEESADVMRLREGHPVTWSQRYVSSQKGSEISMLTVWAQQSEPASVCTK